MSKIKYKVSGYWHVIELTGIIEGVAYENDEDIEEHVLSNEINDDPTMPH